MYVVIDYKTVCINTTKAYVDMNMQLGSLPWEICANIYLIKHI